MCALVIAGPLSHATGMKLRRQNEWCRVSTVLCSSGSMMQFRELFYLLRYIEFMRVVLLALLPI
jgi:hypothetical protein